MIKHGKKKKHKKISYGEATRIPLLGLGNPVLSHVGIRTGESQIDAEYSFSISIRCQLTQPGCTTGTQGRWTTTMSGPHDSPTSSSA